MDSKCGLNAPASWQTKRLVTVDRQEFADETTKIYQNPGIFDTAKAVHCTSKSRTTSFRDAWVLEVSLRAGLGTWQTQVLNPQTQAQLI